MITQEQLTAIASEVAQHPLEEQILPGLRSSFPDVHFSYCMDDDVDCEAAALESDGFNIYLVDSSDHCLKFTRELNIATGVVIAEVLGD